jgi:ketosteroid isomerase-like protein
MGHRGGVHADTSTPSVDARSLAGDLPPRRGILGEAMSQKNVETLKRELKAHGRSQAGVARSEDSVEVVRKAWEAWERRDMQAVFDFYDPAIEWDMSESEVPDMGVYRGHEGVRRFFREWMAPFHDYYAHAEDFTLGSEGVLVRMRQGGRGKESGVDVEMPPLWQLYRLRAGRAVRVEIYRDEHRALEAAGLRE